MQGRSRAASSVATGSGRAVGVAAEHRAEGARGEAIEPERGAEGWRG